MAPSFQDPAGMAAMLDRFTVWMEVKGYAERTIYGYAWSLRRFIGWCEVRSVHRPAEVNRELVDRYARHLALAPADRVARLGAATRYHHLTAVKSWFRWLSKHGHLEASPAAEVDFPKLPMKLPQVLTPAEVERVLAVPDVTTALGLRDRAMLELFYSTGIRRAELVALQVDDLELDRQLVRIRRGKGNRERLVPMGRRAAYWLRRYLETARSRLLRDPEQPTLFLTRSGNPLGLGDPTKIVRELVLAAGLTKPGACHLFRHAMATAMLEAGADLRHVQQMLGHASIRTTQHYTQVTLRKLQEVHARTHPAEQTRSRPSTEGLDDPAPPPAPLPSRPSRRR